MLHRWTTLITPIIPWHQFATYSHLWHVINPALVDVGVLVHYGYGINDRIVVQLGFIVVDIELHLCGFLNRATQLVVQSV